MRRVMYCIAFIVVTLTRRHAVWAERCVTFRKFSRFQGFWPLGSTDLGIWPFDFWKAQHQVCISSWHRSLGTIQWPPMIATTFISWHSPLTMLLHKFSACVCVLRGWFTVVKVVKVHKIRGGGTLHSGLGPWQRVVCFSLAYLIRWGNALSHKLEVGERHSLASHYTLTTGRTLPSSLKTTFISYGAFCAEALQDLLILVWDDPLTSKPNCQLYDETKYFHEIWTFTTSRFWFSAQARMKRTDGRTDEKQCLIRFYSMILINVGHKWL